MRAAAAAGARSHFILEPKVYVGCDVARPAIERGGRLRVVGTFTYTRSSFTKRELHVAAPHGKVERVDGKKGEGTKVGLMELTIADLGGGRKKYVGEPVTVEDAVPNLALVTGMKDKMTFGMEVSADGAAMPQAQASVAGSLSLTVRHLQVGGRHPPLSFGGGLQPSSNGRATPAQRGRTSPGAVRPPVRSSGRERPERSHRVSGGRRGGQSHARRSVALCRCSSKGISRPVCQRLPLASNVIRTYSHRLPRQ